MLISKITSGEAVVDYDSVRLCKDGSKINVSLSISPVHSEDSTFWFELPIKSGI